MGVDVQMDLPVIMIALQPSMMAVVYMDIIYHIVLVLILLVILFFINNY